jgi:hypothetical protein
MQPTALECRTSPATEHRRPFWRGLALFLAGLGVAMQGVEFGVLVPTAFLRGGLEGRALAFGLVVEGAPGGLDVAGVFLSWAVVIGVLLPLGIANLGAVGALLRGRGLPLAMVTAVWFALAIATVVLSGEGSDFLATETLLFATALVAVWPEVREFLRRA